VVAVFFIAAVAPVDAHHSSAPHFDRDTTIELEAFVTDVKFVNPHAYVYFDVEGDDGASAAWRCELSAATALQRRGWTAETPLHPGMQITISGSPARREDNVCFLSSFTTSAGVQVNRNGDLIDLGLTDEPAFEVYAEAAAGRPQYLENGQPNLSGAWVRVRGMGGGMGMGMGAGGNGGPPGLPAFLNEPAQVSEDGLPTRPQNNAAGQLASDRWDYNFDNPALFCRNANIIHGWTHDSHVNEISQEEETVTLKYGYMDMVRTIHLSISAHPDGIAPSTEGHSIGWWEDQTLIVDTVGFSPNTITPIQEVMHSDQMHVVERFRYDGETQRLIRSYVVEDPLYFVNTYASEDMMGVSATPWESYGCLELAGDNNRRPEER
jgi:hypothetical protein